MEIVVLESMCRCCAPIYEEVKFALEQLGINASVRPSKDITETISYGIFSLPALVVDGQPHPLPHRVDNAALQRILAQICTPTATRR